MSYKHGVYVSERATSIKAPVQASAGIPVVVGTAPIHLAKTQEYVNKPLLAYSYDEAVQNLGYSSDWDSFSLCEFMKSHFQLYNVAPAVFINVLDPAKHSVNEIDVSVSKDGEAYKIEQSGILLETLVLKDSAQTLEKNKDYIAAFDNEGNVVISPVAGGKITPTSTLTASFTRLDPTKVTETDIIGGVDVLTGKTTGLELINSVFPKFRLIPGQIVVPKWSAKPTVAAIMTAKASSINSFFKAIALIDVDTEAANTYSKAYEWKSENNISSPNQLLFWPKVQLGDEIYHLSTQAAGVIAKTDEENDDIPYVSPSNKTIQVTDTVLHDGEEVTFGPEIANYLNGVGIITALNWTSWKLWGNRTAVYPENTDVKDSFIPVRRMFNWVSNTIILTYWQNVDDPTNKRLIDTVIDSLNIWLNGLTARGALLGGRVEFLQEKNPIANLIDGRVKLDVFLAAPPPAQSIEFELEFDINYLNTLFS